MEKTLEKNILKLNYEKKFIETIFDSKGLYNHDIIIEKIRKYCHKHKIEWCILERKTSDNETLGFMRIEIKEDDDTIKKDIDFLFPKKEEE